MKKPVVILALGILLALPSLGGSPKKKEKETGKKEEPKVVTNETLNKKYGDPEAVTPPLPSPLPPQPKTVEPGAGKENPGAAGMTAKERAAKIQSLEAEKTRLEKRIGSLKNPYLPRVKPTPEEEKAEKGKDAAARVKMLQERLKKVEAELKETKSSAGKKKQAK